MEVDGVGALGHMNNANSMQWSITVIDTLFHTLTGHPEHSRSPLVAHPLKRGSLSHDCSVRKGIVPHSFHKLTVVFSSISPSQYGYFDIGMLF
jgi:hypothetical protein